MPISATVSQPPLDATPDRVMSIPETAALANLSYRTLKYLIANGRGPRVVRLSARRVGVRVSHFHDWLNQHTETENC